MRSTRFCSSAAGAGAGRDATMNCSLSATYWGASACGRAGGAGATHDELDDRVVERLVGVVARLLHEVEEVLDERVVEDAWGVVSGAPRGEGRARTEVAQGQLLHPTHLV